MTAPAPADMMPTIRAFLSVILEQPAPALSDVARGLDDLAALVHRVPPGDAAGKEAGDGDGDFPTPPRRDVRNLYGRIAARFPSLGLYAVVESRNLAGKVMSGDAIDDLTELAQDLADVAWVWDAAGPAAACRHFHLHYRAHWGRHLHQARLHLHEVLVNA